MSQSKRQLGKLDKLIASFELILERFPECVAYQKAINELKTKRAMIASQIGRKP